MNQADAALTLSSNHLQLGLHPWAGPEQGMQTELGWGTGEEEEGIERRSTLADALVFFPVLACLGGTSGCKGLEARRFMSSEAFFFLLREEGPTRDMDQNRERDQYTRSRDRSIEFPIPNQLKLNT